MRIFTGVLFALLAALAPAIAFAQTTSDVPALTKPQMIELLKGLHQVLQKDDTTVMVAMKDPAQMPAYAPDWTYAGPVQNGNGKAYSVWVRKSLTKDQMEPAIIQSFLLAAMDAGLAGADMKALYDSFAAKDTAAGPNAANPIANRQRLAAGLFAQINAP